MSNQNPLSHVTAIVVDDEHDMASVFSEYLELFDVKVFATGHNGKDAFDLYKKHEPDFVLMDLMMPDYDGYYGLSKIKKFDSDSKVIMITADTSHDTTRKLAELGADQILYKPCDVNKLVQSIRRLCQMRLEKIES